MLVYSSYAHTHTRASIYDIWRKVSFLLYLLFHLPLLLCMSACLDIFFRLFLKAPLNTLTSLPLEFIFPFLSTSATSGKNRDGNNFWCLTKDRNLHQGSPYCPNRDQNHHIWVSTGTKILDLDYLTSFLLCFFFHLSSSLRVSDFGVAFCIPGS